MNLFNLRPLWRQSIRSLTQSSIRQTRQQPLARRRLATAAVAEGVEQSAIQRFWASPVGPKTVHFWAPVMKWSIVIAGISDFTRPAEKLSVAQTMSLTATGIIWTRWCLIIKPKNYLLASVNFFLGIVGLVQLTRIWMYNQSIKNYPKKQIEAVKDKAKEAVDKAAP